ncbi:hypothetical protein GCM10009789_37040 [Kribbella sancticallisti]|uniref:Tachylectin n=1 Tax=Kribbella sancticallisti TaxID=460087 RepID=A0ABP4PJD9_9ACTN
MRGQSSGQYDAQSPARHRALTRATAVAALLLAGATQALPSSAGARSSGASETTDAAAAACQLDAGAVTAGGDHRSQLFASTAPVRRVHDVIRGRGVFSPGHVRLSSEMLQLPATGYTVMSGYVVLGSALYQLNYPVFAGDDRPYEVMLDRIGGGWDPFVALTNSRPVASEGTSATERLYGLRNDGTLYRWTIVHRIGQRPVYRAASYPGFQAVKVMTLLSRTSTYDTLLVTTRGGALYTVRIPLTSPMRPVVKVIRSSTWQGFEALMGSRCGQYGTLLLGIDKNTGSGYLYAVGHANGTATVIRGLGKVPGTFGDPVDFRWAHYNERPLYGE